MIWSMRRMTSDLLSIQTEQHELSHVVSSHQHLPAHRHVHAAVPKTGRKQREMTFFPPHGIKKVSCTNGIGNCRASVCFTFVSPNIVVIMATVLNSGQNGRRPVLKALEGQRALARGHVDFGEVRRTELHPANEVSGSVLCTETQKQAKRSHPMKNLLC